MLRKKKKKKIDLKVRERKRGILFAFIINFYESYISIIGFIKKQFN